MEFAISIDDAVIDALAPAVASKLRADGTSANTLATFALTEMLEWMSGKATYQSLTQQYTDWITTLLPQFFDDAPPTPTQIYNAFTVPYGRAAYIARVLVEKEQSVWRARGRAELLTVLQAHNAEAQQNVQNSEGDRPVKVNLGTFAFRELDVLIQEIYAADPVAFPVIPRPATPGRQIVDIPSEHFTTLIARLS